jgi:hypothetical protein
MCATAAAGTTSHLLVKRHGRMLVGRDGWVYQRDRAG